MVACPPTPLPPHATPHLPSTAFPTPCRPWISLLFPQKPRGGCGSACVFVRWRGWGGGEKKNIAVGSEAAGSSRLWDGGMFFVHNSPSPHPTCRHIHTDSNTHSLAHIQIQNTLRCDVRGNTRANHMLLPWRHVDLQASAIPQCNPDTLSPLQQKQRHTGSTSCRQKHSSAGRCLIKPDNLNKSN